MREPLLVYGLSASVGTFGVAGWATVALLSNGALPGAGAFADVSVTAPLALAGAILTAHCFLQLRGGTSDES